MKKKQCILIMAHKDVPQIRRLVFYFDGKCDIIIHLDRHSNLSLEEERMLAKLPGVRKVFREVSVHWAGLSIVRCQLLLFKWGLRLSDARYFHLLSGQDYPLKPLEDFLRFFGESTQEYIGGVHLPAPHWDGNTFQRIQHYFLTDWFRLTDEKSVGKVWAFSRWQDRWGIRRRIPDQVKHLYGGSVWFSLTRGCVEAVLGYTHSHPSLLRRLRFTFAPDEIYIQTVVRHVDFPDKQVIGDNLRYIHWRRQGDDHPSNLDEKFFCEISSSRAYFARKFNSIVSRSLMNLIDRYLLTVEPQNPSVTGAWNNSTFTGHFYDGGLASGIVKLCKVCKLRNAIDFGCGTGWYVAALRNSNIAAVGYDGNPYTMQLSQLLPGLERFPCEQADLTEELIIEIPYDLAVCLSVGEYVPTMYEKNVWKNLAGATGKYLILAWGSPGGGGPGIVNAHVEWDIIQTGLSYGFQVDALATHWLREHCWLPKYKKEIIVFTKYKIERE